MARLAIYIEVPDENGRMISDPLARPVALQDTVDWDWCWIKLRALRSSSIKQKTPMRPATNSLWRGVLSQVKTPMKGPVEELIPIYIGLPRSVIRHPRALPR